ncbi:MAG TPA: PilZ domain-containing protein [Polyangiaceae bacterium]|nr:PilZ domain-containing protein [Polyangiaceae bacterium]
MAVKKSGRRAERRQQPRVDARLSMRVEGAHDGAQAQVVTESQNISASGVYCLSSHFLPPLSKVQLTIVLPKIPGTPRAQELVKCDGIVVRCEPATGRRTEARYQLACMFASVDRSLRERLEEYVTWRNLQALRAAVAPRRSGAAGAAGKRKPLRATARRKPAARAGSRGAGARRGAR